MDTSLHKHICSHSLAERSYAGNKKGKLQNRAGSGRAFNDIFPKVHAAAKIGNCFEKRRSFVTLETCLN